MNPYATPEAVNHQLDEMSAALRQNIGEDSLQEAVMVGIRRGGLEIAKGLHQRLNLAHDLGALNISFYRDDFSRVGLHPSIEPSDLPFEVDDRPVILVDDVLYSGRTIRAAMNEIFDYGRPKRIILAILVKRLQGRELPICPDVVGSRIDLKINQQIKLRLEPSLCLDIIDSSTAS